ncbi:MAG TPA: hypothetical protein VFT59_01930 [Candidatus Saccharimonadales bacterium]|nr:hypothetical protein [Candidatus Saccharimonadales bacterium]
MVSSLQPAEISLSYNADSVNEHIQEFLEYLNDALDESRADTLPRFDFRDPEYPEVFSLLINGIRANAIVTEVVSRGGYTANVAICHARNAVGQSFFFLLEKNARNTWQPATQVLPMTWDEFIQLTKAEQYTALHC